MYLIREFSKEEIKNLVSKYRHLNKPKEFLPFLKNFPKVRRRLKKFTLWINLFILRILNPKATYVFYYSKEQHELIHRPTFPNPRMHDCLFKGEVYTETHKIGIGIKHNFLDGKIIGIGHDTDIKIKHFNKCYINHVKNNYWIL
jgi:hypothetical protein